MAQRRQPAAELWNIRQSVDLAIKSAGGLVRGDRGSAEDGPSWRNGRAGRKPISSGWEAPKVGLRFLVSGETETERAAGGVGEPWRAENNRRQTRFRPAGSRR